MESQWKNGGSSQHDFCHSGNIDAAVSYLSQELTLLGLPAVVSPGGQGQMDAVALVNAAWRLLRAARDGLCQQTELQHRLSRADADTQQLEASLARCRDQYGALETRSAQQQEQQRQLTAQLSSCQARLNEARDETRRHQSLGQQRAAHHQHELKKQERHTERLKDMTHRLLDRSSGQERHSGMVITTLLGRPDGSRARWRTPASADRAREEAYERVLAGCEARHGRLVEETQRLRTLLVTLLRALTAASEQVSCEEDCSLCSDAGLLSSLEMGTPFDLVSEKLDSLVSCQLTKLTRLASQNTEDAAAGRADTSLTRVQQLRQRLQAAERLAHEQRQLIEASTGDDNCDDSFQRNAFFVEERDELAMREGMLDEQRQALARERNIYTEAVLRLGRERMAFESEKAELKRRQFLASSPLLSGRPASARSDVIKVEPPRPLGHSSAEQRSPTSGVSRLGVTSPALRRANTERHSPSDVTRLPVTSSGRRNSGCRRSSPARRCLTSSDTYLSDLGLPPSLYKSEPKTPTDPAGRKVDLEHSDRLSAVDGW